MSSSMKRTIILVGIITLLLGVGLTIIFSILGIWPQVRDAFLVVLAVATFIALGILCYAIYVLVSLALQLKKEITPVLDSLRDTTDTVRETAKVASDLAVTPGVRAASIILGAAQVAGVFFGVGQARKRAAKRAQRRRALAAKGELNDLR